jgi:protocatechuate 3,4-dioxygenase, alpha subunit
VTFLSKLTPTSSQTVGPYFRIGLEHLTGVSPKAASRHTGLIEIHGQVFDADRAAVPDAVLEFWGADGSGAYAPSNDLRAEFSTGFRRVQTDDAGRFCCTIDKPGAPPLVCGVSQAPHLVVLVFARGLLRHLLTRVYLPDPDANALDLVLSQVPQGRRHTLIAQADTGKASTFHWNVILQGQDETAFFAW